MRVAIVTSGFPPEVGGIETYVYQLARHLSGLGCEIDVVTQSPRGPIQELASGLHTECIRDNGVRVIRFRDITGSRRFRVAPSLWRYLRRNGNEYDVIHVHNFHAFPAFAAAVATQRPLVFTPYYHGVGHTTAARLLHVPYDRLAKRIFARSSYVLCISNAEVALVTQDYPYIESRAHRVGIGLDVESMRRADPFHVDRDVVLVAGRLEAYKHVDRAVEAFSFCDTDAELIIIGSGPQEAQIAARVQELGIVGRVRMLGQLDDVAVRRWQRTATVAMSLSENEAFGLGVAEAAIAGARVVASDIPAHREVVDVGGGSFDFVPLGAEPAEVAQVLRDALTRPGCIKSNFTFPTWLEVSEDVLAFYENALAVSSG